MEKKTKLILIISVFLIIISTVSCAPTIKHVSKEVIESELSKESYEKGRQDGYNEAMTVLRVQMEEKIAKFLQKYKNELLYLEFVKAGILEPGQVSMAYVEGKQGADGSSWTAPTFEWRLISPPRFVPEKMASWWRKDEANFCYFYIKTFDSDLSAIKAIGMMQKPEETFLMSVPYADNSGRWAVIGKSPILTCDENINFYMERGYNPIRVR